MKLILALIAVIGVVGCSKPAETSTSVGREFVVDKLFTHDGCTVYRFKDGGKVQHTVKVDEPFKVYGEMREVVLVEEFNRILDEVEA